MSYGETVTAVLITFFVGLFCGIMLGFLDEDR